MLTTSSDSNSKTKVKLSSVVETELLPEIVELAFGTKISQSVFTPSLSLEETITNAQLESKQSGEQSGDIVPLDFPSPQFPIF